MNMITAAAELRVRVIRRHAYASEVTSRLAATIDRETRRFVREPLPMGDCLIIGPRGVERVPGTNNAIFPEIYTAKIGECFTDFRSVDDALAFIREVRVEQARAAA